MFRALFNIILNLLATLVQIVLFPLNELITNALPDISSDIQNVTNQITNMFGNFSWGIDFLPKLFVECLVLILTLEVAKYTCYVSIHGIIKVWNLFQKLKFW